jgi:protein-tyrosine kinase
MGKYNEVLKKLGKPERLKGIFNTVSLAAGTQARPKEETATITHSNPKPVSDPPHGIDPNLVVYHDPTSVEAEIFKVLRNNILFPQDGVPPRSIMVTSATPGDGKSFVAANLAISIAQGIEAHVLLMDCDMRRSSVHRKFGFNDDVHGLSEYLSKGVPLPSLLQKTVVEKLTILPGGRTPDNPSELLSSQVMKDLIDEAKNRYQDRFIIVDSPPPHLTAETTALATYIDAILIVVRSGKTPKSLMDSLIEKIGREKIIGVVLNGYQLPATERYGYGRYHMHNYGYKKA